MSVTTAEDVSRHNTSALSALGFQVGRSVVAFVPNSHLRVRHLLRGLRKGSPIEVGAEWELTFDTVKRLPVDSFELALDEVGKLVHATSPVSRLHWFCQGTSSRYPKDDPRHHVRCFLQIGRRGFELALLQRDGQILDPNRVWLFGDALLL